MGAFTIDTNCTLPTDLVSYWKLDEASGTRSDSRVGVFAKDTDGTLPTNLIAYWKLGEASGTRSDSKGSNNLTDNNTVTSAAGKWGTAGQFTAAN